MGNMKPRELLAAVLAVLVGGPLIYMYSSAIADGQGRAVAAPLRAMLGSDIYEALADGDSTPMHYMGDNRSAPDFTLPDSRGRSWNLEDQRGKVVIMNFWSITCQPCVEEMPSLITLSEMLGDRDDVELVAISTDQDWDQVSSLFPPGSKLRVLFDPERAVTRDKFGTRLYPETWFVDTNGVIRLRYDGPFDWSSPVVMDLIEAFQS